MFQNEEINIYFKFNLNLNGLEIINRSFAVPQKNPNFNFRVFGRWYDRLDQPVLTNWTKSDTSGCVFFFRIPAYLAAVELELNDWCHLTLFHHVALFHSSSSALLPLGFSCKTFPQSQDCWRHTILIWASSISSENLRGTTVCCWFLLRRWSGPLFSFIIIIWVALAAVYKPSPWPNSGPSGNWRKAIYSIIWGNFGDRTKQDCSIRRMVSWDKH